MAAEEDFSASGRQNRRAKDHIISALQDANVDASEKNVLWLLLMAIEEIGGKIDAMWRDERTMQAIVLNGHTETHHADHDWVQAMRAAEAEQAVAWAKKGMAAEEEAKKTAQNDTKVAREAAIRQAVTVLVSLVIGGLTTAVGALWWALK